MSIRYSNWASLRAFIVKRDKKTCLRCGHISQKYYIDKYDNKRFESDLRVDHILPLALGGDNSLENLQTLCLICAESKNNWDQHLIAYVKRFYKIKQKTLNMDEGAKLIWME